VVSFPYLYSHGRNKDGEGGNEVRSEVSVLKLASVIPARTGGLRVGHLSKSVYRVV
jgi:hypothetical protein